MKKGLNTGWTALCPLQFKIIKQCGIFFCMAPLVSYASEFSDAEKLIKSYDQPTRTYLYERMVQESNISPDPKAACNDLPGGGVTQILRINQDGVVDLVVSNVKTEQSDCFEKVYLGRAFKAPPSAPVYIKQKLGYGAAK